MMDEIRRINAAIKHEPEVLFVADSMTGQDAANTAPVAFQWEALPLSGGVVLTPKNRRRRLRGGARCRSARSPAHRSSFLGTGEKLRWPW